MNALKSSLSINQLNLNVSLGWLEKERLEKQTILLDVDLSFTSPPAACTSDQLQDTYCYSDLIDALKQTLENRTYHLVEHLSHDAYLILKKSLPHDASVFIRLTKHPAITGLARGVTFSLGDSHP